MSLCFFSMNREFFQTIMDCFAVIAEWMPLVYCVSIVSKIAHIKNIDIRLVRLLHDVHVEMFCQLKCLQ